MKSLFRITGRYLFTVIMVASIVLGINLVALIFFSTNTALQNSVIPKTIGTVQMEAITQELIEDENVVGNTFVLSSKGLELLKESGFLWAMLLDETGKVVYQYQLPTDFPDQFSIADVAAFSRWYYQDYPVRVWRHGDKLMVFGLPIGSYVHINALYEEKMIAQIPKVLLYIILLNLCLLIFTALLFGVAFYRSLKPVVKGIEQLPKQQILHLREKGTVGDLAKKINEVSCILNNQSVRLAKRDNARTEWIAGVSHDIRTPLSLIIGYSDQLAKDASMHNSQGCQANQEDLRKKAEIIRAQSLLIKQLISDLNLTSKLEYHAQPLCKTTYSPCKLFRECVTEYYNQGLDDSYQINLQISPEAESIRLEGDTNLLLRAMRNIIGNSIRHNPQGCQITIHLSPTPQGISSLFEDSGKGIPKEVVEILSAPQEDLPSVTDNNTDEHASRPHIMGLHIVKQIVSAHGGATTFVLKSTGGYDVMVSLPLQPKN